MRDPLSLPASSTDGLLNVVVEAPAGSTNKIKWEPELGSFALSRPLPLGMAYPHDWGFVPGTRAADGDPVDAMVLSEGTTYPGLVIACRPIGVLRLEQNRKQGGGRERNDRILAVAASAASGTDSRGRRPPPPGPRCARPPSCRRTSAKSWSASS